MSSKLNGYAVAGYMGEKLIPESAITVEVLADSEDAAIDKALQGNQGMKIAGIVSEKTLKGHAEDIEKLQADVNSTLPGFIVAGIQDAAEGGAAITVAVLAEDEESALQAALQALGEFSPIGTLSGDRIKKSLKKFETLKSAQ